MNYGERHGSSVKRYIKRYGWIGAVLCLALVLAPGVKSLAVNENSGKMYENIINKQNEISQIQEQRKALESGLTDMKMIMANLQDRKKGLKDYVATLDGTLAEIGEKITALTDEIEEKEEALEKTRAELVLAKEAQEKRKNAMYLRMRIMYEKGDSYLTEMFMQAADFAEALNRADYMEKIMEYDQRVFTELKENAEYIALCEEELEIEKIFLDEAKASVEREQQNVETLIEQKTKDIEQYESDIEDKEAAIKEYEDMIAKQNAEIEALERAIEEEKKRIRENQGTVLTYDGGTFKFPLAYYTRVSDDYGYRMHPILNVEQFHNGVDFAAPSGTDIYAAYNGNVVAAAYSDTMGNYVMIDHGDSLYTIYMHASALYVSKGDVVTKGEVIAAVGTTGRSTGNHLHFGVRKNGAYVSPWSYLTN